MTTPIDKSAVAKMIDKLGDKQAFFLLLLMIVIPVAVGGFGIYNTTKVNKIITAKLDKVATAVERMEDIREGKIINILNKEGAASVYEKTFDSARLEITELMMKIIVHNHIRDAQRQKDIQRIVKEKINVLYEEDVNSLSLYKYKDHSLDVIMLDIDPTSLSTKLTDYLIKNSYKDHNFLANETVEMLKTEFSGFLNHSKNYLKKIDRRKKDENYKY